MLNILLAESINLQPGGQFTSIQSLEFGSLIGAFLKLILVVASLVFFFILVLGGINWILSGDIMINLLFVACLINFAVIGLNRLSLISVR